MFCAICAKADGPFTMEPDVFEDALAAVCFRCTSEPARAYSSPRGYEVPEGMGQAEMCRNLDRAAESLGVKRMPANECAKSATPGWIVVRVRRRSAGRKPMDAREARETLQALPWASLLRYLGADQLWHLFERPGPRVKLEIVNPLAAIERFRK